jgi:hypothetical protein
VDSTDFLLIESAEPIIRKRVHVATTAGVIFEYFPLDYQFYRPFDNIESAQEYLALLSRELDAAKQETQVDIAREADSQIPRRRDALRLVVYTLEKLEQHIKVSRRLLNDLRTLRRLLLEERTDPVAAKDSKL